MRNFTDPLHTLPSQGRRVLWVALVGITVILPWLTPYTVGPRANAVPWLVSSLCLLTLLSGAWLIRLGARHNPCQPTSVMAAWLAAALLSCAIGLAQYVGAVDAFSSWLNFAPPGQAYGNLRQRNQFATLTSIGLIALLYLARRYRPDPHSGQALRKTLLGAAVVLLAIGNAASASRTGAVQWLLLGLWCLLPTQRHSRFLAWQALLVYAMAVLALPVLLQWQTGVAQVGLFQRLSESSGCESRRVLWANVLDLIAAKPWAGWGWGELKYAHFSFLYTGERFCAILDNAHNLPLHLAVELGAPLATTMCAAVLWGVWRNRPWQETDARRQAAWAVLGVIGMHSMLEYPLWYGPFQMALGLCLWMLWRRTDPTPHTAVSPWGGIGLAILSVAWVALIYTTWDYTRISQLYLPKAQRLAMYQDDTLAKARPSRLFAREVQFAELTTMALTDDTAPRHYTVARALLHYSPEPRVLQALLDSAQLQDRNDADLQFLRQRFAAVYPEAYAQWLGTQME